MLETLGNCNKTHCYGDLWQDMLQARRESQMTAGLKK